MSWKIRKEILGSRFARTSVAPTFIVLLISISKFEFIILPNEKILEGILQLGGSIQLAKL